MPSNLTSSETAAISIVAGAFPLSLILLLLSYLRHVMNVREVAVTPEELVRRMRALERVRDSGKPEEAHRASVLLERGATLIDLVALFRGKPVVAAGATLFYAFGTWWSVRSLGDPLLVYLTPSLAVLITAALETTMEIVRRSVMRDVRDVRELTRPTYTVQSKDTVPKQEQETWYRYDSCCLGISLDSDIWKENRLECVIDWMESRHNRLSILIGDSLYAMNLRGQGLDEGQAQKEALNQTERWLGKFPKLELYSQGLRVYRTSEVELDRSFLPFKEEIQNAFRNEGPFREAIQNHAKKYVANCENRENEKGGKEGGKKGVRRSALAETTIEQSQDYLLRELAILAVMADRGWPLLVYLGKNLGPLEAIDYIPKRDHRVWKSLGQRVHERIDTRGQQRKRSSSREPE